MSALLPHVLRSVALNGKEVTFRPLMCANQRFYATAVATTEPSDVAKKAPKKAEETKLSFWDSFGDKYVPAKAGRWKYTPADFKEFPERDIVNFPHPNQLEFPSKHRLGMIPDSWFKFFYEKTGETGGYVFLAGLGTFLLQKEFIIIDQELHRAPFIVAHAIFWYLVVGRIVGKFVHEDADLGYDINYNWKQRQQQNMIDGIEAEKVKQQQIAGILEHLFDAKRENLALQLEGVYRERVNSLYQQVKRQLDFLMEYESTRRRFEMTHMANWIVTEVRKSISPQLEDAALQKCVADLQTLAKENK